jgi:hypothetical protein
LRLEQSSTEVDEGEGAAAWSGFHGWAGVGEGLKVALNN